MILPETLNRWEVCGYNKAAVEELYIQHENALKAYRKLVDMESDALYITSPLHPNQMLARLELVRGIVKRENVYVRSK
ncbi:hypothetical protein Aeh1ORF038c [Aeromonas phage Aeh1]|uniref:Uncharacterized protein n=1 Tax=Aeromonas phage Aeh1 TaxID=2880362 RepID=Q76Z49_9CAUD|nr:hypothetical protein Aeh1p042 [Aeromonas phage Aeh1]AAQ17697.1 hypothetical protein Aeh1ORF038c [Aeromonas phage Aeh1]